MSITDKIIKVIKTTISFLDNSISYLSQYKEIINNTYDKIALVFLTLGPLFIAILAQVYLYYSAVHLNYWLPIFKNNLFMTLFKDISLSDAFDIGIILYIIAIVFFILVLKKRYKRQTLNHDYLLRTKLPVISTFKKGSFYLILFFIMGLCGILILFLLIDIIQVPYNFSYFIIWIITILCWLTAIIFYDRKLPNLLLFRLNKQELFFILMGMITAGILAIPYNGIIPPVVSVDMPGMFLSSKDIAEKFFTINLFSRFFWDVSGIGFLLHALSMKIFGYTLSGLRMSSAIIAIITVPVFYLLGRNMFGRKVAGMAVIILLCSHLFIQYTRSSMWSIQSMFLHIASILCFIVAMRTGQKVFMFLAGLIAAFSFLGYAGAHVIILVMAIYFVYLLIRYYQKPFKIIQFILVYAMAFVIVLYPVVFNAILSNNLIFIDNGSANFTLLTNERSQELANKYQERFNTSSKLFILGDLTVKAFYTFSLGLDNCGCYETDKPHLDFYLFILSFFSLFLIFFKRRNCYYVLCFIFTLCVIIFGGILSFHPYSKRMILCLPYIILMASITLSYFAINLSLVTSNLLARKLIIKGVVTISVILIVLLNLDLYFLSFIKNIYKNGTFLDNFKIANVVKNLHTEYLIYTSSPEWIDDNILLNDSRPGFIQFNIDTLSIITPEDAKIIQFIPQINELPIKKPVNKDICFLFDNNHGYFPLNIILNHYPGGKFVPIKYNNADNFYYMYIVPKEIINNKLIIK